MFCCVHYYPSKKPILVKGVPKSLNISIKKNVTVKKRKKRRVPSKIPLVPTSDGDELLFESLLELYQNIDF